MNALNSFLRFFGRLLMAVLFFISGLGKFIDPALVEKYIASQGLSAEIFLTYGSACIEVLGGFFLFIGFFTRSTALILFAYLVAVTVTMHTFWQGSEAEMALQFVEFLKNLGILGGLLYIVSVDPGQLAVTNDTRRKK